MLRPEKDHDTFLRAARSVVDRVPNAKFLIVGDGPMRPKIERLVRELDLDDCVVLTGSRSDVPDLLRAIDVFVLSSYTVECFPMALLEAMAAGRPAVCTAVGGVPEMIEEPTTGYLVPPRDPGALADRLVRILSDSELAHRMGQAARARVETLFSLRASVSATEHALEELVGTGQRPDRPVRLTVVLDLTFVGGAEVLLAQLCSSTSTRRSLCRGWCACAKPAHSPTSSGRPASMSRFSAGPADSTCEPCRGLSVLFAPPAPMPSW